MHDPGDDAAIIDPWNAANLVGQEWLQSAELRIGKPKQVIRHGKLLSNAMNHRL